jgi:predicted DNA-binding transcriptional regulator AlpA
VADLTKSRLLDEKELAALLGVSVSTVRHWRYSFQGPPVQKVGRSVRYDVGECEEWLAEQKHPFWRGE